MSHLDSINTVSIRQAKELTAQILQAGLVPNIEGPPGCGKSSFIRQISKEAELQMIDHRMSTSVPEDMSGLPRFRPDGFAEFAPFVDIFPLAKVATVPDGKAGWLLFLDEFNSAERQMQAAAYKLILDHMVGQHHLHPDCHIILAGNRKKDRAITNDLSSAMQSRVVTLEVEVNFKHWLMDVAIPEDYDRRLISYLSQYPSKLMEHDPNSTDKNFNCPRTWEHMNKLIKVSGYDKKIAQSQVPLYAGTIAAGTAVDFVQFTHVYESIIPVSAVVSDPENTQVPFEMNLKWATATAMVDAVNRDTYKAIDTYMRRFDASFRILFNRMLVQRNPKIRTDPIWGRAQADIQHFLHEY